MHAMHVSRTFLLGGVLAFTVSVAGCGSPAKKAKADDCENPPCDGPITEAEHEDMLGELGVNLSPDAPTDPNGEPLPAD